MFKETLVVTFLIQMISANGNICYASICIPQNYSKSIKPTPLVEVSMIFNEIQVLEIDDSKSIIEMYLYMEYEWQKYSNKLSMKALAV